tara:strand:- start:933 stop:1100 length:168 start_codon:yes stop_codon:yes gene_type:complete
MISEMWLRSGKPKNAVAILRLMDCSSDFGSGSGAGLTRDLRTGPFLKESMFFPFG